MNTDWKPWKKEIQAGTRKNGRLTLLALRQGNEIWVSVECGLATPETVVRLTPAGSSCNSFSTLKSLLPKIPRERQSRVSGLSAVKTSLQRMQGEIERLSRPGKRTRITVKLPRQH